MSTENRREKPDLWPGMVFLVFFLVVVVGVAVGLRITAQKPMTPETVAGLTATPRPSPAVTASPSPAEARIETPSAFEHEGIITHERIPPPTVSMGTPAPESSPPVPAITSRASPTPASHSLALRITNPDYGTISVNPYSPNNQYPRGSTVTLAAAPQPGNKFDGWYGDTSSKLNAITVVMDRDRVISGDFSKMRFTLSVDPAAPGGAISISPNLISYEHGAAVQVEAKPAPGYIFQSWSGDVSGSQNPLTINVDRDNKIGALFQKGQYTLTTKVNPSGFIDASPPGVYQDSGARVTLTARPSSNYRFVSWSGDVTGANPTITITVNSNKAVTANFIRIFTLTTFVNPPGYGTVSPSLGEYDDGTEVVLTAVPISGYEFVEWSGQVTGNSQTIRIIMNSDKSAMAFFQPIKYPGF